MSDRKPIRRALLSVYDKDRLLELGQVLADAGVEILSTGSTAKTLSDAGISVTEVSSYTGFPEIMGCLLYTSPSPRDRQKSRMPSSA